jgi:hypothetical protein
MGHSRANTVVQTWLCVRRKKELVARPHLSAKRGGRRGTQATAVVGQRPAHMGEGEGEVVDCAVGRKEREPSSLFSISFLFSIFLTSYYVNLKWFEFKFKCNIEIKYHHMFNKQANTQAHKVSHIKFVLPC